MNDIETLAQLLKIRNATAKAIASIVNRPAQLGHIGEFIASKIFNIRLMTSATTKGIDGHFMDGVLKDRSVNIKWYGKHEGLLDIKPQFAPDFYLVMTGPKTPPTSSRGTTRPWVIEHVFLFESASLIETLKQRGVKISVATSVIRSLWNEAEIYPHPTNARFLLSKEQVDLLNLFKQERNI